MPKPEQKAWEVVSSPPGGFPPGMKFSTIEITCMLAWSSIEPYTQVRATQDIMIDGEIFKRWRRAYVRRDGGKNILVAGNRVLFKRRRLVEFEAEFYDFAVVYGGVR